MKPPVALLRARCADMGVPLTPDAAATLVALLDRIGLQPQNLTAVDDLAEGVERHLADSLAGLVLGCLREAPAILDIGSGAGFPGIPLAVALPTAVVTLVESEGRKADWLRRASEPFPNLRVVGERTEILAARRAEAWPAVTARAVATLPVVLELAAPLVELGGSIVVWRGERRSDEERAGATAAAQLGLEPGAVTAVRPFPDARRHLHEYRKVRATPGRFPRRPGRAAKRPLA